MSFSSPRPTFIDMSAMTHLLRNPFLIFRLVLLALLGFLAFLTLIFASWNIDASLAAGFSAPSTSIFIIFECCLFLICIIFALAEFFRPVRQISRTIIECSWVGVMTVFQIGAAISSTVNGPAVSCHLSPTSGVCASSLLLVPSTWLSTILALAYFLTLLTTALAHKSLYPDVWRRTVYNVEWFGMAEARPSKEQAVWDFLRGKPSDSGDINEDPFRDFYEDIECSAARKKHYPIRDSVEESTPWAPVRRGIDDPFPRPQGINSNRSSPTLNLSYPSLPDKSAGIGSAGSRYLEKFRESSVLSRAESPAQFTTHYHAHKSSFPSYVSDLDKPIPLPQLSEWVRADPLL